MLAMTLWNKLVTKPCVVTQLKQNLKKHLNISKKCLKNFKDDTFVTFLIILLIIGIIITLTLGSRLRRGFAKGCGPKGSMGVTFHVVGSVGECEGMNLHTLKWVPSLRVGVPKDFQIFKE